MDRTTSVLSYWFGDLEDPAYDIATRNLMWFGGDPAVDDVIRSRFAEDIEWAAAGEYAELSPRDRLAVIILLDQFPRNIYRGTPQAFAYDDLAQALCWAGVKNGEDQALHYFERAFFYLPLEHAEDRKLQKRCVACFTALHDDAPPQWRPTTENYLDYAIRHKEIIDRFGRFPHRNDILGRSSTREERQFLTQPNSSF